MSENKSKIGRTSFTTILLLLEVVVMTIITTALAADVPLPDKQAATA